MANMRKKFDDAADNLNNKVSEVKGRAKQKAEDMKADADKAKDKSQTELSELSDDW